MALIKREEDFSKWYNELVEQAWLAQTSAVRGCMVVKPYGYAIWENMQRYLDAMFKYTWHTNAYFPIFIPKSFFSKEAKHVDGFAKEAAVVTHYRLKNEDGQIVVDPEAKLEEELIIRPTSETIIRNTYKDWIQSYRDLPILINQRANVVRREMRTRVFLRTSEFLRQEWHTAHATSQEAMDEAKKMRKVYQDFFENFLALSGVAGEKSANERFAGAENTYTIECMMQDGKALQACTSHFLWQNFWKAFDVTFTDKDNKLDYAWATSWGASTRMIGWLIMSHSDDKWLVLPPAIAPVHVVIVPIWKTEEDLNNIKKFVYEYFIKDLCHKEFVNFDELNYDYMELEEFEMGESTYYNHATSSTDGRYKYKIPLKVKFDADDQKTPGRKYNQYELQWVPIRIAVWPRDVANGSVELYRRDTGWKEILPLSSLWEEGLGAYVINQLRDIQNNLYNRNKTHRQNNTVKVDDYDEFKKALEDGKFVLAHRDGTIETEEVIKQETKATIRCIPSDAKSEQGRCIKTWKPSNQRVVFALSY